jgi:hypothetical protein
MITGKIFLSCNWYVFVVAIITRTSPPAANPHRSGVVNHFPQQVISIGKFNELVMNGWNS